MYTKRMAYKTDTKTITVKMPIEEYDALKSESESTRTAMTIIIRDLLKKAKVGQK